MEQSIPKDDMVNRSSVDFRIQKTQVRKHIYYFKPLTYEQFHIRWLSPFISTCLEGNVFRLQITFKSKCRFNGSNLGYGYWISQMKNPCSQSLSLCFHLSSAHSAVQEVCGGHDPVQRDTSVVSGKKQRKDPETAGDKWVTNNGTSQPFMQPDIISYVRIGSNLWSF